MRKLERLEQLKNLTVSGAALEQAEWFFPSTIGNTLIHVVFWTKTHRPKAILQLSHGMCEHIGRYDAFARAAAEQGILVVGSDHLGHGLSVSSKEYYGYFGMEEGQDNLVRDLYSLTKRMKDLYPGIPYVLFGHSFGSMLAQLYVTRFPEGVDLLLLCGVAAPNPLAGVLRRGVEKHIHRFGLFNREAKFRKLQTAVFNWKIKPHHSPNDWISTLPEVVEAFDQDPLCGIPFTAAGYRDLLTTNILIGEKRWFGQVPKQLPVRIFSGALDPVGEYGKGARKLAQRLQSIGVRDVTCKIYPNVRHELLNESCREEATADFLGAVLDFLSRQETER